MLTILALFAAALAAPPPVIDCPAPGKWVISTTNTLVCSGATTPVDPPPVTGGDVCVSGDVRINNGWGNPTILTSDYGDFGGNVVAVKVAPPAGTTGTNQRSTSWAEYGGPRVVREAAFSNVACSFKPEDALKNSTGLAFISKESVSVQFVYRIGDAGTSTAGLTAGQVYYINIRNRYADGSATCPGGGCTMRGNLPD